MAREGKEGGGSFRDAMELLDKYQQRQAIMIETVKAFKQGISFGAGAPEGISFLEGLITKMEGENEGIGVIRTFAAYQHKVEMEQRLLPPPALKGPGAL